MTDKTPATVDTPTVARPKVVTFYSFKCGLGRSMALVAVANRLATERRPVLMVDADLEAPGITVSHLDREQLQSGEGFAEIVTGVIEDLLHAAKSKRPLHPTYVRDLAGRVAAAIRSLPAPAPKNADLLARLSAALPQYPPHRRVGALELLPAGRVDDKYAGVMQRVPFSDAFGYPIGGGDRLRRRVRREGILEGGTRESAEVHSA
ncbi:MAG: hypothetical protein HYZ53_12735 [Planctomycetes bacterium]|nr:hypothetical protein [Planctomycetota bacterium]